MQGLYSGGFQVTNAVQLPQLETLETFTTWLNEQLKALVGIDNVDEIIAYVVGMDDEEELKSYFLSLIGTGKKYNKFIDILLKKKKAVGPVRKNEVPQNAQVYVKSKEDEETNKKKKTPTKKKETQMEIVHGVKVKVTKSKQKVDQIVVPGRHICDCQATEHPLVGNCLNCGKIICSQEGTGPCLFCSSDGENGSASNESLEKAIKHKDQLLEYDRTSAQRTVVFDDQADYFTSMNQWVTPEEREKMEKQFEEERRKKEEERYKNRITFDFAGRKIVVGEGQLETSNKKTENSSNESKNAPSKSSSSKNVPLNPLVNPNIDVPAPKFTKKNVYAKNKKQKSEDHNIKLAHRIQHEYYEAIGEDENVFEANSSPISEVQVSEIQKPVVSIPEKKSPFKWRGIVQDVPRTEREKELIVELMEKKRMNYYLLFLESKNWREKISTEVLQNITSFAKSLQAKKITTNIGVTIGNDFDFTSKQDLNSIVQIIQSITSQGFRGAVIRLDKNLISLTDANKKIFKSIGEAHCSMMSELLKQLGGKVVLNIAPPLEFSLDSSLSKFQADYFQSIAQNMPDNVGFILHGNWKSIYLANVEKLKLIFKGRRVIVIDPFPPSQQDLVFLHPYDKRDPGIDKYIEGIAISPPIKNFNAALIGLWTAFDYLAHPPTYDSDLSLKSAISRYIEDQRLADELFQIIKLAPGTDATSTFVMKTMPSKQSILELQERLKIVKKSITSEKFGPSIFPFLQFMDSFCIAMLSK